MLSFMSAQVSHYPHHQRFIGSRLMCVRAVLFEAILFHVAVFAFPFGFSVGLLIFSNSKTGHPPLLLVAGTVRSLSFSIQKKNKVGALQFSHFSSRRRAQTETSEAKTQHLASKRGECQSVLSSEDHHQFLVRKTPNLCSR